MVSLSADPIHYGHIDLITQAKEKCDELIVWVAMNDNKKPIFNLEERLVMVKKAINLANIYNVLAIASDEMLVDVYMREGCDVLFRGIRDEKDRQYED
ncbi:adenylyltransferase/cytidyltransferase family protein [Patescibacteria group bacterium]|nr:adenylyltransferase/cytidyltransferase family protein [Patescibacteria group bacterium]